MNNNKKHLHIKIISTALCMFVALQLFGCSSLNLNQSEDSSSREVETSLQSSSNIILNSFPTSMLDSSSSLIVSSSEISSSGKKASSSAPSKTSSSSSKPSSSSTANVASSGSSVNIDPNLYKPLTFKETRGVWIAELGIDFPKSTGEASQEQEIRNIVQNVKNAGLNTIFFQVRPMADALYKSSIFPWSKYLTGTQGKYPGYDPLAYLIEEAHKSNIAVQAWINPYRVCAQSNYNSLSANNPAKLHPEWTVTYTDSNSKLNCIWFNPGLPAVRNLITQGVTEIVKNYNIDGIHFDDYFYPYSCTYYDNSVTYSGVKFDDSAAYKKYGNGLKIDDWRRHNVNLLVKQVHDAIKSINGNMQFGISPSGIWATKSVMPLGTSTIGMSSYSALYADSRLWVTSHCVDYICPQIYWGFNTRYAVMVDWWSDLCAQYGVALYIGHYSSIVTGGANVWTNSSGINQVQYARTKSAYKGSVYFSYRYLSSMAPLFKGLYY